MAETVRGGTARPIDPGIIARLGQRLKDTIDVWFGPLDPQQLSTPAGMPPRRFDYPSGANLTIQPRNYDSISFQQMRDVADAFDLVRIAIETRKDQVSKAQWSFRLKKETGESKKKFSERTRSDPRIEALNKFFRAPDGEHDWDEL